MADPSNLDEVVDALHDLRTPLVRLLLQRQERRRADATVGGRLSTPQHLTLSALVDGPLAMSELAVRTGVALSTATRMVQGLERSGLVGPSDVPDEDRRRRYVQLTPGGRRAVREADDAARNRLRGLLASLGERERALILEAVTVLTGTLAAQERIEDSARGASL